MIDTNHTYPNMAIRESEERGLFEVYVFASNLRTRLAYIRYMTPEERQFHQAPPKALLIKGVVPLDIEDLQMIATTFHDFNKERN